MKKDVQSQQFAENDLNTIKQQNGTSAGAGFKAEAEEDDCKRSATPKPTLV